MTTPLDTKLWVPRSVEDTKRIYADWALRYDADMDRMAYATPDRVAGALRAIMPDRTQPILDFGCGTGRSGKALAAEGFPLIDGTDISPEMLAVAEGKRVYRHLWEGTPGIVDAQPGDYSAVVATGVISLGAAPPDMLETLLQVLAPGGLLAFSYNDPTLEDASYLAALEQVQTGGLAELLHRAHGPHLSEKVTGSEVIVLRRL